MPSFVSRGLSGLRELLAVPDRLRAHPDTHKGHERKTVTLSEKNLGNSAFPIGKTKQVSV